VNIFTGKIYIGYTTTTIAKSVKNHLKAAMYTDHPQRIMYFDFEKYGLDNFYFLPLGTVETNMGPSAEKFLIEFNNTYNDGYNVTRGGEGSVLIDRESVIGLYKTGKEVKEIAAEMKCDAGTVSLILEAHGIDARSNCTAKRSRRIRMCHIDTHNSIMEFASMSDAARWVLEHKLSNSTIKGIVDKLGRVAIGKTVSAYGFFWEYVDDALPTHPVFQSVSVV
jgi:hypothetical protein